MNTKNKVKSNSNKNNKSKKIIKTKSKYQTKIQKGEKFIPTSAKTLIWSKN